MEGTDFDLFYVHLNGDYPGRGGIPAHLQLRPSGLFQTFFGMENMEEKYMFFTVLLHFGTLISVCMVYWRDIVDMIREFFLGIAALAGRKDTGVARRRPDGW